MNEAARLILGPRPGKKSKLSIKERGVTNILTLLSDREQPENVRKIAREIGASWHHFAIDGGHFDTLENVDLSALFKLYDEIAQASDAPIIYLHCSAGIHRTGFVIYALLRYRGLSAEAARAEVATLRLVTPDQVGEDRIALAETKFETWQASQA